MIRRYLNMSLGFFCLCMFALTIYSGFEFSRTITQIDKMRAIDTAARNLLVSVLDAETGQRGYVITGNAGYLAPYGAGISSLRLKITELRTANADTVMSFLSDEVENAIQLKADELARVIRVRDNNGMEAAAEQVSSHLGKNLMDGIRSRLDKIEQWAIQQYFTSSRQGVIYARVSFISMLATFASGFTLAFRSLRNR